jgi:hypothetical protein
MAIGHWFPVSCHRAISRPRNMVTDNCMANPITLLAGLPGCLAP